MARINGRVSEDRLWTPQGVPSWITTGRRIRSNWRILNTLLTYFSIIHLWSSKRSDVKTTRPGALQYSAARTDDHRRHVADSDGPDDGHLACKSDRNGGATT